MKKAIFYATYNGVFDNTNGIGTQTQVFLSGIDKFYSKLRQEFGDFDIHLVTQEYNKDWPGFSEDQLRYANIIVHKFGGDVHFCSFGAIHDEFWSPKSWKTVSQSAAAKILEIAKHYSQSLVIANDIPFLQTPLYIERSKHLYKVHIQSLIAMYGTSYIHTRYSVDPQRLGYELEGLSALYEFSDVKIGNVGAFMHDHLIHKYNVKPKDFVPYRSSLLLNHSDFKPYPDQVVTEILEKNNIPLDKKIIFAFGRAVFVKGFDIVLKEFNRVSSDALLVLNVVPYLDTDPILHEYAKLKGTNKNIRILKGYKRDLPKALSQWHNTKIVVCPSRGEPLSNIPFEVSLWAQENGPVLLCADCDGYKEQITHGQNGFLFDPNREHDLISKIDEILHMKAEELADIRKKAYNKVFQERDFHTNFRETLQSFWKHI